VVQAVAASIATDTNIGIALSGGMDSMVLLDAVGRLASTQPLRVSAVHVHHGLSPNADRWAEFCEAQCSLRAIDLTIQRVEVLRAGGESVEAVARAARYQALAATDVDAVLLAHHADDQAETVLLQLLRGAGPHGLAGMPARRDGKPAWVRPLLNLSRAQLAAYAVARALSWVDDESNADHRYRRNYLRSQVTPALDVTFPGYPSTIVRAAAHQAQAAALLDDLAAIDAADAIDDEGLDRQRLIKLSSARAGNLLRWYLDRRGLRPPSTARLADMLRQLANASGDARLRVSHDGMEIGIHRGRVVVHVPRSVAFARPWNGEAQVCLPGGIVTFEATIGDGVAASAVERLGASLRSRAGGERIRLAPDRPQRALKKLLQERDIPAWDRCAIPLLWCGNQLAAVAGIGVAVSFQAAPDEAGWRIAWRPQHTG
jgi:tRNA(Ile)-lysidine synthase